MTKPALIIDVTFNRDAMRDAISRHIKDRKIINLADPGFEAIDLSEAAYALVWKPHDDLFRRATGLKAVFSGGAGVDHVLKSKELPDIPLVRFVDSSLTTRMSEWVVMQALMHLRQHASYEMQRHDRRWFELPQPEAGEVTIGIMGLGILGRDCALKLKIMGFKVIGWSKSRKTIDGIETFKAEELDVFLARSDILLGLLPLTPETHGIFNRDLFSKLRKDGALGGPVFINAGRGASQVESDLIEALDDGTLRAASLDVFATEPLPASSPFWTMANIFMTPHASAASDLAALSAHVARQIERFEAGEPLEYVVDRSAGY